MKPQLAGQAIIIPGEAPETDDEAEIDHDRIQQAAGIAGIEKGSGSTSASDKRIFSYIQKQKHDSLLHSKLRDSHINLAVDVADFTGKVTRQMNAEVQRVAQNVGNSQLTLQDTACNIRSVAEDLYKIDDCLDAIFDSHATIPDLANFDDFPTVKEYGKIEK